MAAKLILLVEDSPIEGKIAEAICLDQGYRNVVVTEGDKALGAAIEHKPDLVLLDVILPNKNGFQVCRQIKKDDATKDVKVVIVSSKDQASDKFWGLKQGADDYLTKPYKEDDLKAIIEKKYQLIIA